MFRLIYVESLLLLTMCTSVPGFATSNPQDRFEGWLRDRFSWTGEKTQVPSVNCQVSLSKSPSGSVGLSLSQGDLKTSYFMQDFAEVYFEEDGTELKLKEVSPICEQMGCVGYYDYAFLYIDQERIILAQMSQYTGAIQTLTCKLK